MNIIRKVSFNEVVHSWLKAEWKKHGYDKDYPQCEVLVDNPNFKDSNENEARLNLLCMRRKNIIQELPEDTVWFEAAYGPEDIDNTYNIASGDWLPITSGNYHIRNTLSNVSSDLNHASWIREIYETLPNPDIDTRLIVVAKDDTSVMTILEGNHRAVALLKYQEDHPEQTLIEQVYVGLSKDMDRNNWHVGHPRNSHCLQ